MTVRTAAKFQKSSGKSVETLVFPAKYKDLGRREHHSAHVTTVAEQPTDLELRQSLARGQYREAFERLLELYKEKVFHLACSMLGNETQAEDATQDIFLKAWKGLPGYNGQASLSTWLYTISRNTCLTALKRRTAHATVSLDDPGAEGTVESLARCEDPEKGASMDVHQMLVQLPEKYRQVIMLFYLEQKSYEETAALMGIPLGTVKTFLYRARKELLKLSQRVPMSALT